MAIESIQLALFLHEPAKKSASGLWMTTGLADPTGFQTIGEGHTQAQGPVGGASGTLIVQQVISRVDLLLTGHQSQMPTPVPASLQDPAEAMSSGLSFIEKLLAHLKVGRTACVVQAHVLASAAAEAALKIKEMVPGLPLPDGAEDVTYQLVVPAASKIDPRRSLRQMCRWQTASLQLLQIGLAGLPSGQVAAQRYSALIHADVFADKMDQLTSDEAMKSLVEVSSLAHQIVETGYVHFAPD